MTHALVSRWLTAWLRRKPDATNLPLGLAAQDLEALDALRASPHWPRYLRTLERLAETQAAELASGVPHGRYLFACGALTALRRTYTLVDDLLAAGTTLKETTDARSRDTARRTARNAATFVNTPWYDGWRADAAR